MTATPTATTTVRAVSPTVIADAASLSIHEFEPPVVGGIGFDEYQAALAAHEALATHLADPSAVDLEGTLETDAMVTLLAYTRVRASA
jgi:leucyl aminopeptidase (aminopeptidase T)